MSLVDEVAAHIRTTIADLGYLNTQLATALHDIEHAQRGFAQASRGTTSKQLPQAVAACGEATERLVAAISVVDNARELLWNYLLIITPGTAGPAPVSQPLPAGSGMAREVFRDRHGFLTDGVYRVSNPANADHAYATRRAGATDFVVSWFGVSGRPVRVSLG